MTVSVDFASTLPLTTRPEILQHPQIPPPLAGINPRQLMPPGWWDEVRRRAYAANNYHCLACAISPDDDPYGSTLEAHECYDINWKEAMARYRETVALCWRCHNFIHAGRLSAMYLTDAGEITLDMLQDTLRYGETVLSAADLRPYWRTWVICRIFLDGVWESDAIRQANDLGMVDPLDVFRMPDHKWRLEVEDRVYDSTGRRVRQ